MLRNQHIHIGKCFLKSLYENVVVFKAEAIIFERLRFLQCSDYWRTGICPHLIIKRFSAYDGSWHEEYADNSWIVGTWSCTTPYGTVTLKFEGDGSSGSCAELTYGSYNYGRYSVKDGVLRYKLNGESLTNVIEIHDSNMLYFGDGYYLHKN